MSDLIKALKRKLEFDDDKAKTSSAYFHLDGPKMSTSQSHYMGQNYESVRLAKVHAALVGCVEALDKIHGMDFNALRPGAAYVAEEALAELRRAVEGE